MLEKDVEKLLNRGVKKLGGRSYKWVSPGNAGVPDRIVFFPNIKPIFIELKSHFSENPRKLQKAQMRKLEELGQDVRVLRGPEEVKRFLEVMENELSDSTPISKIQHRKDNQ